MNIEHAICALRRARISLQPKEMGCEPRVDAALQAIDETEELLNTPSPSFDELIEMGPDEWGVDPHDNEYLDRLNVNTVQELCRLPVTGIPLNKRIHIMRARGAVAFYALQELERTKRENAELREKLSSRVAAEAVESVE